MSVPTRLLIATNNPGKVREFRRLLARAPFEVVTPAEAGISLEVEETGSSYAENAVLKARAFAVAGGCLALGDDSGIEVDALAGAPGMYSARFGGPGLDDVGRTALLLDKLGGVPAAQRSARYRAVVAIAWPDGESRCFEGVQEGAIGFAPVGDHGFGYDPVFLVDGQRAQAEISDEEKDRISHRAQAVRAALAWLAEASA
jgi:XTP/dITP diphosphohydrolase